MESACWPREINGPGLRAYWKKSKEGMLDEDPQSMPRHWLEQIRGFLIYVIRTYPCMVPYLIGLHMTIDSWRPNRREDGWRYSGSELKLRARAMEDDEGAMDIKDYPEAPVRVKAAPRLEWDIDALRSLMSASEPLL
jgi:hypothetical protein